MEDLLELAGLNELQAKTYLYLLRQGESSPPAVAKSLALTRSNAYKILDKLVALGLLRRVEIKHKFVYQAEDPIALATIVASERNRLIALEKGISTAITQLRHTYEKSAGASDVQTYRGNTAVTALYEDLAKQKARLRGIKSRVTQSSQLTRGWIDAETYTSPVEWAASRDELLIISFEPEASAIRIKNPVVAKAFRELCQLLDSSLRKV